MLKTADDPNRIARGMANAPHNAWYVIAGTEELGEKLLSRRVLDIPLVLYRTAEGEPVALFDRCPHRWMPLSLGNRVGDDIQCLYHGIQFGAAGHCTKIPSQPSIPSTMKVRRFPIVDKPPLTWIWMGDEEKADPALIPNYDRVKPGYSLFFNFCYPIEADFLLLHENLMDTSHPSFLHVGYFDDGQLVDAPFRVETEGNMVRLIRDVGMHVPRAGTQQFFNLDPGRPVRQVTITETFAPSLNVINYQFDYPDEPERPKIDFVVLAPITPAGPRLCYHFVASAFSWLTQLPAEYNAVTTEIIKGDQLALEAIEQRRDEMIAGEAEVHIRADGASLYLRRLIRGMAEAEHQQA